MKKKFKIFWQKKYNQYLLVTFLSYILPVVIFGHWNIFNSIYFPISILLFYYLLNYKVIYDVKSAEYLSVVNFTSTGILACALQGLSVSIFGISVFGMTMQGTLVQISVYSGILVYLLSLIPFIIFSEKYRREKKKEYELSFIDEKSKERDININKILGIRI